jgi:hypothetical protein
MIVVDPFYVKVTLLMFVAALLIYVDICCIHV